MKTFTFKDIKSWNPCYCPSRWLPESWTGTAVDILKLETIPLSDRLWCVLRLELVSEKVMRLFAVWSYRQTLNFIPNQDPRSIEAANVAERFANGEATRDELSTAYRAAYDVVRSGVYNAAKSAALSALWSASCSAAPGAIMEAVKYAAYEAAWSTTLIARRDKLIQLILEEDLK